MQRAELLRKLQEHHQKTLPNSLLTSGTRSMQTENPEMTLDPTLMRPLDLDRFLINNEDQLRLDAIDEWLSGFLSIDDSDTVPSAVNGADTGPDPGDVQEMTSPRTTCDVAVQVSQEFFRSSVRPLMSDAAVSVGDSLLFCSSQNLEGRADGGVELSKQKTSLPQVPSPAEIPVSQSVPQNSAGQGEATSSSRVSSLHLSCDDKPSGVNVDEALDMLGQPLPPSDSSCDMSLERDSFGAGSVADVTDQASLLVTSPVESGNLPTVTERMTSGQLIPAPFRACVEANLRWEHIQSTQVDYLSSQHVPLVAEFPVSPLTCRTEKSPAGFSQDAIAGDAGELPPDVGSLRVSGELKTGKRRGCWNADGAGGGSMGKLVHDEWSGQQPDRNVNKSSRTCCEAVEKNSSTQPVRSVPHGQVTGVSIPQQRMTLHSGLLSTSGCGRVHEGSIGGSVSDRPVQERALTALSFPSSHTSMKQMSSAKVSASGVASPTRLLSTSSARVDTSLPTTGVRTMTVSEACAGKSVPGAVDRGAMPKPLETSGMAVVHQNAASAFPLSSKQEFARNVDYSKPKDPASADDSEMDSFDELLLNAAETTRNETLHELEKTSPSVSGQATRVPQMASTRKRPVDFISDEDEPKTVVAKRPRIDKIAVDNQQPRIPKQSKDTLKDAVGSRRLSIGTRDPRVLYTRRDRKNVVPGHKRRLYTMDQLLEVAPSDRSMEEAKKRLRKLENKNLRKSQDSRKSSCESETMPHASTKIREISAVPSNDVIMTSAGVRAKDSVCTVTYDITENRQLFSPCKKSMDDVVMTSEGVGAKLSVDSNVYDIPVDRECFIPCKKLTDANPQKTVTTAKNCQKLRNTDTFSKETNSIVNFKEVRCIGNSGSTFQRNRLKVAKCCNCKTASGVKAPTSSSLTSSDQMIDNQGYDEIQTLNHNLPLSEEPEAISSCKPSKSLRGKQRGNRHLCTDVFGNLATNANEDQLLKSMMDKSSDAMTSKALDGKSCASSHSSSCFYLNVDDSDKSCGSVSVNKDPSFKRRTAERDVEKDPMHCKKLPHSIPNVRTRSQSSFPNTLSGQHDDHQNDHHRLTIPTPKNSLPSHQPVKELAPTYNESSSLENLEQHSPKFSRERIMMLIGCDKMTSEQARILSCFEFSDDLKLFAYNYFKNLF